jgi:hypothetical protein
LRKQRLRGERSIPIWVKVALTAFAVALFPIYLEAYGPLHFLWLSDVALFLTVVALWRESRLLNSMMAVGVLPMEVAWNLDFFALLLLGLSPIGLADYMLDPELSLHLRILSLFHIPLPIVWIWLLRRWGYDRRAVVAQTLLFWAVILASYLFTDPADNINWVFSYRQEPLRWMPARGWLAIYLLGAPVLVFLPVHALLSRVGPAARR